MENKTFYKLGSNIRGLRKSFGETQLELAIAVGVDSASAISNYELGDRIPERDILLKIAKHYRITEDELINGDYSNIKNLSNVPIDNDEYNKAMFDKLLPLICDDDALKNTKFNDAYNIHLELYKFIIDGVEFDFDRIKHCMEMYDSARKDGVIEGAANYLWWLFYFAVIYYFATPKMVDSIVAFKKNRITVKDILHDAYLPSFPKEPDKESPDEETHEFLNKRKKFIADNEVTLLVNIHHLKHTQKYQDLADYYLALRYKLNVISNTLSPEMNSAVGHQMMLTFSTMGNCYAERLISFEYNK